LWTTPDRHTEQDDVVPWVEVVTDTFDRVSTGVVDTSAATLAKGFDKTPFMCEPCQ
jgi:hypothetical protein